jgi:hypothetical protein
MESTAVNVSRTNLIVDEAFSNGMVERPILLAMLEDQRFSYCVLDKSRQKMVVLADYKLVSGEQSGLNSEFFKQVLLDDDILSTIAPEKVIFSIHADCSVLVPAPLFSKDHAKEILELACRVQEHTDIYEDHLKLTNAYHIYAVPEPLLKETGNRFKDATLFHCNTAFIESQLMLNKHELNPMVSVNVSSTGIDLVVTNGSELLFSNVFRYQTSEDFIYFLLFALEQLQLSPDNTPVRFYGEIDKTSANWMAAKKYIRFISFGDLPEGISFAYGFDRLDSHQYYLLFSQHLCAS